MKAVNIDLPKEIKDDYNGKKDNITENLLKEVEKLNDNTPDGTAICDGDTILADIMEDVNFEENGLSKELFDIYNFTTDKIAFEDMFLLFTNVSFRDYLLKCKHDITR